MTTEVDAVAQLKTNYEANKVVVATAIGALNAKIQDLVSQLGNSTDVSADVMALANEVAADTAALQASQAAPVAPVDPAV